MFPSQAAFQDRLAAFAEALPPGYTWAVETRNPNYLNPGWFDFLRERNLAHVWLRGTYMPPFFELCEKVAARLDALAGTLKKLKSRKLRTWVFVNNHYEGSAPLTMARLQERLRSG